MNHKKLQIQRNRILRFHVGNQIGRYQFLSPSGGNGKPSHLATRLGDGGSAVVYLVGQRLYGSRRIKRAIKFFFYRPDIAKKVKPANTFPTSRKEFLSEIINFSQISHQSLVSIIDAGIYLKDGAELPYIVTDYVEGPTLKELIESDCSSSDPSELCRFKFALQSHPERILSMLVEIARAIQFMHDRGFFHCDIAAKNIFLKQSEGYRPIIGDLGLGVSVSQHRSRVIVAGTRAYMPPDLQSKYGKAVSWDVFAQYQPRWDLYSYAKTALELSVLIPDLPKLRWRAPLIESLRECCDGTRFSSVATLLAQLEWLSPIGRVPELSPSISGQQKKVIPVDSLIISDRVRRLTDHPALLRLARIPQLTVAKQVFPGAIHTRYEHALGTMESMRRYLLALVDSSDFLTRLNAPLIETALICALLSNLTRHPLHHILGELHGVIPKYDRYFSRDDIFDELFARRKDQSGRTLQDIVRSEFPAVDCALVRRILLGQTDVFQSSEERLIYSMLNCSLDVRVADFIRRDSVHLGLSGFSFDLEDLLGQLTVYNDRLALRVNGLGVAEQLIAMRYWLFHRIYWNTPNRAYICMVRYCLSRLGEYDDFIKALRRVVFDANEQEVMQLCLAWARNKHQKPAVDILQMLCHAEQPLFRIALQANLKESSDLDAICRRVAEMDFPQMLQLADRVEKRVSLRAPLIQSNEDRRALLLDMPPDEKHAGNKLGQDIMVLRVRGDPMCLADASEIVDGVNRSFTRFLRRLRVFCHPSLWRETRQSNSDIDIAASINEALALHC